MNLRQRFAVKTKIAVVFAAFLATLVACQTIAQESGPANPVQEIAEQPGQVVVADVPDDARSDGIPTDALGIAGAMGWPFTAAFIAASIVGVWSFVERLVVLRRRRIIPRGFTDRFLMHLRSGRLDKAESVKVCEQNMSPIADVFLHGLHKWGRPSAEVEKAVSDGGERQVTQMKKGLRVLNGVSTLSPLLGLQGTVVGMIQSFNDIATAGAMGQTQTLATGIAQALLTTAVGLFIAIPAMTAYLYLAGRIDSVVMEMDRLGQELVHLISAEALRERAIVATSTPEPAAPVPGPARTRKPVVEK